MSSFRNPPAWTAAAGPDGLSVADAAQVFAGTPSRTSGYVDDASLRTNNMVAAAHAHVAVAAYARHLNQERSESAYTTVGDLISDLRHYCDALGIDWADVTDTNYYDREVEGQV